MSEKTPRDHESRDEALRDLLRAADPAGAERPELDPIERANLRQQISAAAEENLTADTWSTNWSAGRPAWLLPAMAAAVLVAAVGLAVWSMQIGAGHPSGAIANGNVAQAPQPVPGTEAPDAGVPETALRDSPDPQSPTPAVADVGPSAATADAPDTMDAADAATTETIVEPSPVDTATPEATAVAATDATSPDQPRARTLRFVAPRGTRIIWTLDPNYESPTAGQAARQE